MKAEGTAAESANWLTGVPASPGQRKAAGIAAGALVAGLLLLAPFAGTHLPRLDAFVPAVQAMMVCTDLITAVLLFSYFRVHPSWSLLTLAASYLLTALTVATHVLMFPGAFAPAGLFGAGIQSAAWMWLLWHATLPTAIILYVLLKDRPPAPGLRDAPGRAIAWTVSGVCAFVLGAAWAVIAWHDILPEMFLTSTSMGPLVNVAALLIMALCVIDLLLLWRHGRSVLGLWLGVAAMAVFLEVVCGALLSTARFTLGFYAGRIFSLFTATVVLGMLLAETTRLYFQLARSHALLERERSNKMMQLEAMMASFSHEMRQPLSALVANGRAAQLFLARDPPDLGEARSALTEIVADGKRASNVIDSLRELFVRKREEAAPVSLNAVAADALDSLRHELDVHGVSLSVEFAADLPRLTGHRGQLQELVVNLVQNAIDAMRALPQEERALLVRTAREGDRAVLVVKDHGPGVDAAVAQTLFDPFVSTKPEGSGLGLAICRTIAERHGGDLALLPGGPGGAAFRLSLPAT
jgi:signal transduction histidine kinase